MTKSYLDPDVAGSIQSQAPRSWIDPDIRRRILAQASTGYGIDPGIADDINAEIGGGNPPSGFIYLLGSDGAYLLGADGAFLYGVAP